MACDENCQGECGGNEELDDNHCDIGNILSHDPVTGFGSNGHYRGLDLGAERQQCGSPVPPGHPEDPFFHIRPQSEEGTNPKDLIGDTKPDLSLVPPAAVIYMALAMGDGAVKYGPYNWRENKVRCRVYLAACMRHIQSYLDGEECAQDSGKPHLAHALACLGIITDAKETGNLVDDRPVPGAAARLIAAHTKGKNHA